MKWGDHEANRLNMEKYRQEKPGFLMMTSNIKNSPSLMNLSVFAVQSHFNRVFFQTQQHNPIRYTVRQPVQRESKFFVYDLCEITSQMGRRHCDQ